MNYDEASKLVEGRTLPMSIELFERRCLQVVASIPLDDPLNDRDMRELASDAVRLCREFTDYRAARAANLYNPFQYSIIQATFGTWNQYAVDDFVEALLDNILKEITRVHWNVFQHEWKPSWRGDGIEDPEIPGIAFVRYYDGCPCEDEPKHWPDCRHMKPNFQHEDTQFSWYKYPGRGMSTNKDWSSDEWRAWFQRCLATVRAFDVKMTDEDRGRTERLQASLRERFPKEFA